MLPGLSGCSLSPSNTTPVPSKHKYFMFVAVGMLWGMTAGSYSNCRMEKLGALSSGPIRQRMRQLTAPSVSTGAASICS